MRQIPILYIIMCALTAVPASTHAQQQLSPKARIAAHTTTAANRHAATTAQDKVTVYVTIDPTKTDWETLRERHGLQTALCTGNAATARIARTRLAQLAQTEGVSYVQTASTPQLMLDMARTETGADRMNNGESIDKAYTGKGVVVGIVDAGFDYNHAAFRTADGQLRIKRVWEQPGAEFEGCTAPEKYGYGIEMKTPEIISKAAGDNSANSHGTHVAAIATGSDNFMDGAFKGVAPDADIVLVAVDVSNCQPADISNAIGYIFDYADETGQPCVVNLSLGNHDGPHDGTSTFDAMADRLQGPGRLIVGAAGNHRADKFHIDHTFTSADDEALKTFIAFKNDPSRNNVGGDIEIWGEKGADFEVVLSAYSLFNNKDMVSQTVYPAEGIQDVTLGSYATGTFAVAAEESPLNGKSHVVLTSQLTGIRNNYAIALAIVPKSEGRVNIWADNAYVGLESRGLDGFTAPDGASTIAEIGGTGKRILSVGAYTTRNEYVTTSTSGTLDETVGNISSFSSYGPTADGRLKPEISAPGCFIISALSGNDASGTQMVAYSYSGNDRTYSYGYMQGTSMSSPFVAGTVAAWLEAYPKLTPEELHDIVKETARNDSFTGDIAANGDNSWGYGKLDALAGIGKCLEKAAAGCEETVLPFNAEIMKHGNNMEATFLSPTSAKATVYTPEGRTIMTKDWGNVMAGQTCRLDTSQLKKGVYLLEVRTSGGTRTMKFVQQ